MVILRGSSVNWFANDVMRKVLKDMKITDDEGDVYKIYTKINGRTPENMTYTNYSWRKIHHQHPKQLMNYALKLSKRRRGLYQKKLEQFLSLSHKVTEF